MKRKQLKAISRSREKNKAHKKLKSEYHNDKKQFIGKVQKLTLQEKSILTYKYKNRLIKVRKAKNQKIGNEKVYFGEVSLKVLKFSFWNSKNKPFEHLTFKGYKEIEYLL